MAGWQDFIRAIRRDEDEEKKRDREGGIGNRVFGFLDDVLDVGERTGQAARRELASIDNGGDNDYDVLDVIRDTPAAFGDAVKTVGGGILEFGEDVAQSIPRFGAEVLMSGREALEDTRDDQRRTRIDELLSMDESERERIANDDSDPRSFQLKLAKKQLGSLSNDALTKRKLQIETEDKANDEWKPGNAVTKFIFGGEEDEKARTIQKRTEDYSKNIEQAGEAVGADKTLVDQTKNPLAFVGAVGAMALDSPFGKPVSIGIKGVKELGKEGIEQIAKSVDVEDIVSQLSKSKNLMKVGDDTIRAAAERLKDVTDPKEVDKLLRGIKKIQPAPAAATDEVASGFPIDQAVRDKVSSVVPDTPVPEGMTRLYQGTENGQPTDWYFNDPEKIARYFTGRDEGVTFRSVDVPTESARAIERRPGVFRVSDALPSATDDAVAPGSRQISPLANQMAAEYSTPDEIVDDIVNHWWDYDKNAKGGQLINRTGAADAGPDDYVRISDHSPFYSRFYKENGRKPSKAALRAEVVDQLERGDGDLIMGPELPDAYGLVRDRVQSVGAIDEARVPNSPSDFTDVVQRGTGAGPDPLNPATNVGPTRTRVRSFLQTAQRSPALTDETKDAIAAVDPQRYTVEQQAPVMEEARKLVDENQDEARRIIEEGGTFDARKSAILQQYIRKLSSEGRGREAAEYAERLSNEALKAGRGNAMIAAMSRLTPEGILTFANRTVERYAKQANKGVLNKLSNVGKGNIDDTAKQIRDEVEGAGQVTTDTVKKAIREMAKDGEDKSKTVGEQVASRVANTVDPPKKKKKVDQLVNELTKKIRQEQLAVAPTGPKRTATDVLREVFQREGEAQEAWPEAQQILREKFADNPEVLDQLDKFFSSNLNDRVVNAASTLDTAVRDTLRKNEVKISEVIQKSWADQTKTVDDMAADLTKEGFSPEAAQIVAKQATDNLTRQVADAKKRALDNLMKDVPERARPTFEEKIAKLSNMGALDDKDYLQIAQKRLNLPSLDDASANRISELAQKMQGLPDGPEKDVVIRDIMDTIAETLPITAKEKFEAFRYQNLLSSPRTQLRNVLANSFNALVTRPATLFTGAAGDTVSSALTGKPRERYFSELPKYYQGIVKGFFDSQDAMAAAWRGEADLSNPDFADVFGQTGIDQARRRNLPKKWTVVSRLMEAQDKMFSGMIAGGEYAAQVKRGVPEEVAREAAHNMAEYSLLRQALDPKNATGQGDFLSKIDQASAVLIDMANKMPGGRWVMPFIRTPLNFTKQWLEFSPVGLTDAAIGKGMTPEKRLEALNKGLLGTSVLGIGATLAADDRVTWAVPENEKERDLFYAEGKKPYSVKVGDNWIPLINFGPFGLAMAIPAGVKYNFSESSDSMTQDVPDKLVATALDIGEMLSQQTFLNGVGTLIEALQSQNGDQVEKVLANFGTQAIPLSGLQRYVATIVDPTYREPKGFVENLTAGVPGFSLGMEAQENSVTGEPVTRNWSDYLAPYSVGQPNEDPVRQENTEMTSMFYQALRRGGDDRTKTNEAITEALVSGDANEALRLATEHNRRVSESMQEFRTRYGEQIRNNPELLQMFMRDYQSALISNPLSRSSLQSRSSGIMKKENMNSALNQ